MILMKYKLCPAYDAETELIKQEIGSARGEILYSEKEIVISERCSFKNVINDFDCSDCPIFLNATKKKQI